MSKFSVGKRVVKAISKSVKPKKKINKIKRPAGYDKMSPMEKIVLRASKPPKTAASKRKAKKAKKFMGANVERTNRMTDKYRYKVEAPIRKARERASSNARKRRTSMKDTK